MVIAVRIRTKRDISAVFTHITVAIKTPIEMFREAVNSGPLVSCCQKARKFFSQVQSEEVSVSWGG